MTSSCSVNRSAPEN